MEKLESQTNNEKQLTKMSIDFACKTCALRFTVGSYHFFSFESGYWAEALIACTACGAQHSIKYAVPDREAIRNVEMTCIPAADRRFALQLILEFCRCTPLEAKTLIDHLPARLAEQVQLSEFQVGEWTKRIGTTGIKLAFPVLEKKPTDRLLGAPEPRFSDIAFDREEIAIIAPLSSKGQIVLAIQKCRACSAIGTLSGELDRFAKCPHCKQATLERVAEWIT